MGNSYSSRYIIKTIIATLKMVLVASLFVVCEGFNNFSFAQSPQIYTSSSTFTVPACVSSITIEVVGGGGTGGGNGGGGGGGGGYSSGTFAVTAGANLAVTVGGAGSTTSVAALISATGGANGGTVANPAVGGGGAGGVGSGGSINRTGGTGGGGYYTYFGGGGAGAAGSTGVGGNGGNVVAWNGTNCLQPGGAAGVGGGAPAGNGGKGAGFTEGTCSTTNPAAIGVNYGGGGGGGNGNGGAAKAGAGGYCKISWTANPAIANNTVSAAQTICSGIVPAALTGSTPTGGSGAYTYLWESSTTSAVAGFSAASGTNTNIGYIPGALTVTTWYRRTVNSGGCTNISTAIQKTVNPLPTVTTAATDATCSGTGPNIALTASVASTFTWTIGTNPGGITGASAGSGSPINQVLTNPSNSTANAIQYIVTPTSSVGSCVGPAFTITVTVNPKPVVSNPSTKTICTATGTAITLAANGVSSTYAWTLGAITGGITGASATSGASISQTLTNPSNITDGTVPYIVTPTSTVGSCVGNAYTITVTVTHAPTITNAATATICSGTASGITLAANQSSTFTWTIGSNPGGITGASAGSGSNMSQTLTNPSNSIVNTIQYIVTPTSTVGALCSGPAYTITVTVNPKPVVTTPATDATCSGTGPNVGLTASVGSSFTWTLGTNPGGITGASAGAGSTINQTLTNPNNASANAIQYLVTPTSTTGSCVGPAYTITVTVNPKPVVTNAATKTICTATSTNIALGASAPSSFTWTIGTITGGITGASAGSGNNIGQTLTNPSNSVDGTVQYLITPTATTGSCVGVAYTITVTVTHAPTVSNATTASTCSGTGGPNISLAASESSTFTWTIGTITGSITGASAGSGGTINQTLTNPSNSATGTVQYLVRATSTIGAACAGPIKTITVTVNPKPAVTNNATAATCSGTSPAISLGASAASSFTWTIGTITGGITGASASSGGTINQILTNPSNSTAGTVQYIVTPTSTTGSCVGAAFTITVTVDPKPAVTNAATKTICTATSTNIVLEASAGSTYAWTIGTITGGITGASASSGGTINQTLTNPSNSVDGTVQYIVTPTSTGGICVGNTFTITVTVTHAPTITNAATKSICNGTGANISLIASESSTFTWTIGTITGSITGASAGSGSTINQTLTNPSNSANGTVQYIVRPTSTLGALCLGPAYTITVTVYPTPAVTYAATKSICSGISSGISLTSSTPGSFTWTVGTITGGITGASAGSGSSIGQILTNPSTTTAGTVQYLVTPTATAGSCIGPVFTITVTVNVAPIAIFTGGTNQTVCSGTALPTPIALGTSNSIAGTTFAWTRNNTTNVTGTTSGSGNISGLVLTNTTTSIQTVTFTVTPTGPTSTFCPGAAITTTVTVNPIPVLSSSLAPPAICNGNTLSYTATSATSGSTFAWTRAAVTNIAPATSSGTGNISEALTNGSGSPGAPINVTYVYTTTANGCSNSGQNVVATVNVLPIATITNSAQTICSGANFATMVLGTSNGVTSTTFTWTRNNGAVTGIGASGSGGSITGVALTNTTGSDQTVTFTITPSCSGANLTATILVRANIILNSTLSPSAICSGSNFAYTPSSATPSATFSWTRPVVSDISSPGAASGTGSVSQVINNSGSGNINVTYVYTTTNPSTGCSNGGENVVVAVQKLPVAAGTISGTPLICQAQTYAYSVPAIQNATSYTWSYSGTGVTINGSTANITVSFSTSATSGNLTVRGTNSCGNGTVSANYAIALNPNASIALTSAAGTNFQTVCVNIPITDITYNVSGGGTGAGVTALPAGITSSFSGTTFTISGTPTVVGTFPYTITTTGTCIQTTAAGSIIIAPLPTLNSSLAPPAICSHSTFSYTPTSPVSGATFTWTRAVVAGISNGANSGSGNPSEILYNTTLNAVPVTYIYTVVANGCSSASTYNVVVSVKPQALLSSSLTPPAICSGTAFSYTPSSATSGSTFAWSRSAVGGISQAANSGTNDPNEILTNTTVATVNVTYLYTTTATGCSYNQNVVVQVTPTPTLSSSLAPPAACSGVAVNYTPTSATPGASFTWTRAVVGGISNGAGSGSANPFETLTNTTNLPVSVTYIYTVTANSCTNTTTFSVVVPVNPRPTLNTSLTPSAICSGTVFSYVPGSSVTGATFAWSRAAVGGISNAAASGAGNPSETLTNTSTAPINVTYVYTTSANGCNFDQSVVVTVNPTPTLNSSLAPTVCSGSTFNYTPTSATSGASFSWTRAVVTNISNGAGSGTGSPSEILTNTSNTSVSVTYIYTVTANSCTNSSTFNVVTTVYPRPTLSSSLTPVAICSNSIFNYSPLSSIGGATFAWSRPAIPGISNAANSGVNNPAETLINTTAAPVNVTYVYTTSANGCNFDQNVVVTVNPNPALNSSLSPTVCSGSAFNYTPTSATSGASFTWTRAVVPNISNGAGSGSGAPFETLYNTTTVSVNVTYIYTVAANGCTNPTTFNVVATVYPSPTLSSTLTPPAICSNTIFNYNPSSSIGGATFSWSRAAVGGISNAANSGSGNPAETLINTTGTPINVAYTYTTSANGCNYNQNVIVTVNPSPSLNSSLTPTVCSGATFNYTPTSVTPGASFAWTRAVVGGISNGANSGTGGPFETLINTTGASVAVTYIYTVSANGCTNSSPFNVVVTVYSNPTLSSSTTPPAICSATLFSYTPSSSTGGATFAWSRATVPGISNAANNGTNNPNETLTNTSTVPVNVVYIYTTTANGCSNNQNVIVTVNPKPVLNSSLSPTVCSGASFNYTPTSATPGTTFAWTRAVVAGISNGANSGAGTPFETLYNTTGASVNVTYIYTLSANGCTNSTTFSVIATVYSNPTLSSTTTPTAICSGTLFSYTPASGTGGATFAWSRATVPGISNAANSGTNNPNEYLPILLRLLSM